MAEHYINIEEFEHWKVDVLKEFCKKKKCDYIVAGKHKKSLTAFAYALLIQNASIDLSKAAAKQDYTLLLDIQIGDSKLTIPDPFKLSDGWKNEKEAVDKWPMYLDGY